MTDPRHGKPNLQGTFVAFSLFIMSSFWLIIATYPQFFIFNPFDDTWAIRQWALVLSLAGWLMLGLGSPAILYGYAMGWNKGVRFLPLVALFWPISVVINQILLVIRDGVWYFEYLINYPIFIASDILLPMLLLVLWRDLKISNNQQHSHAAKEQPAEQS